MRKSKDEYFLELLSLVANRSTCPRRAVGAIFVDSQGHVLSTGYNGVPANFVHCTDTPCGGENEQPGQTSKCLSVHAEQNAILQCQDLKAVDTLYVSCTPCFVCTKMLLNISSLRRVVSLSQYPDVRALDLWKQWFEQDMSNRRFQVVDTAFHV